MEKMFTDWSKRMRERMAKGRVSGSASRMVKGCIQLSNCAARMRYMKMKAIMKATMKALPALAISLERPALPLA